MNVPFPEANVRYVAQRSAPDLLTINASFPFASVVPGGIKPEGVFYLNLVRITSMGLSHPEDKMTLGSIDTLVAYCGLKEMDRLAEVTVEK